LSVVGSLLPEGRLSRRLRHSRLRHGFQVAGSLVGFFVASYTGVLLEATNQPVWSQTDWIAPLFLASAASTGISATLLVAHLRFGLARLFRRGEWPREALEHLERADLWALALEAIVFAIFLASLGWLLFPVCDTEAGQILLAGTAGLGLLLPLAL